MLGVLNMNLLLGNKMIFYCIGGLFSAGILFYFTVTRCICDRGVKGKTYLERMRKRRLVVISGCDSGLGLTMACWAAQSGYKVLAGCLDDKSPGAKYLKEFDGNSIFVSQLDVTDKNSTDKFQNECKSILKNCSTAIKDGGPTKLWAVISNAGVAVYGECFWQTEKQQEIQMKVNFWGTVNLATSFKPLLLHQKARLIVITSSCALLPFPLMGFYSATKSALQAWAMSMRLELSKYGVTVVAFEPGAFSSSSRLFASQETHYLEMKDKMSESDKLFYGSYFDNVFQAGKERYDAVANAEVKPIESYAIRKHFFNVLEKFNLGPHYVYRDIAHRIILGLPKYLPQKIGDDYIHKLMSLNAKTWEKIEYPIAEE